MPKLTGRCKYLLAETLSDNIEQISVVFTRNESINVRSKVRPNPDGSLDFGSLIEDKLESGEIISEICMCDEDGDELIFVTSDDFVNGINTNQVKIHED